MDYQKQIKQLLHYYEGCDVNDISLDSHLMKDLGLDSLDHVEFIMKLEEECDIEITDKEAETLQTVRDVNEYLAKHEVFWN